MRRHLKIKVPKEVFTAIEEPFLSWRGEHSNNQKNLFPHKEPFVEWEVSMKVKGS